MKKIVIGILSAAIAAFSSGALAAEVKLAGSTTVQKRIMEPGAAALKKATGITFTFNGNGTGQGVNDLLAGKADGAGSSETLIDAIVSAEKWAKEKGLPAVDGSALKFNQIAVDEVVVIVNKSNPVASLTKEQIIDLHTGKIKNWKEIGGADAAVKVITSHKGSATRNVFQKQALGGADYVAGVVEVKTTADELNEVSKDAGAIGAVSAGFFEKNPGKTKTVKTPVAIKRPLGIITKGPASAEIKQIVDFFLSPEGKKLIE